MAKLAAGTNFVPRLSTSSGKGVLQVDYGNTTVYLWGSIEGSHWTLIESFTADAIKEVVLTPFFVVSGNASDQTTGIGTSQVWISETRGG
jgi:hypothetical protein